VDFPEGACNGLRTTRVQRVAWNADGTPDFGIPVSTDEAIPAPSGDTGADVDLPARVISRFRWYSYENTYLRHSNFYLRYDSARISLADSQFVWCRAGRSGGDLHRVGQLPRLLRAAVEQRDHAHAGRSHGQLRGGRDLVGPAGLADETWISWSRMPDPDRT
jgi:hypothetical protein